MATNPNIYDRTDPTKNYDKHLFLAGAVVQSAEVNEIQSTAANHLRDIGDALFKDGDIQSGGVLVVDPVTGISTITSARVYIAGVMRAVPAGSFTVPVTGTVTVGVYLNTTTVTWLEDPELRDPATGVRNYNMPGAERLKVQPSWGFVGDNQPGEFYPIYVVQDGAQLPKTAPPNLDSVTQSIASYDRDSTGGTYVVSGLAGSLIETDPGDVQVYSIAEGRARVNGYSVVQNASRRITYAATPDLQLIDSEPHLAVGNVPQRINVDSVPIAGLTSVKITARKTTTMTRGSFTGGNDPLPDTSVLSIVSVVQGGTTYVSGTDYRLSGGGCDWSLSGAEPATGSTYTVTYLYITNGAISAQDSTGFTVTGAVDGTLVLVSYNVKLPRIDRLCMLGDGSFQWVPGVASLFNPLPPTVGDDMLPVILVRQTWDPTTMSVGLDGVRIVSVSEQTDMQSRIDYLMQGLAQIQLQSNIASRDTSLQKGIFVDPFLDDSMRDAGVAQTASIVNGELILPISGDAYAVSADVSVPTQVAFTRITYLSQVLQTGSIQINPYQAFAAMPASVVLNPAVDNFTSTQSSFTSGTTLWYSQPVHVVYNPTGGTYTSVSTYNQLVNSKTTAVPYLRQIPIAFTITGFGANEVLATVTFDGLNVTPTA